jgi:transposase-like protein
VSYRQVEALMQEHGVSVDHTTIHRWVLKHSPQGVPNTITIDGSDAHEAAITRDNEAHGTHIMIRQVKYLKNMVEQDHRALKRVTRPLLGFQSCAAAHDPLVETELMHRLKKGQLVGEEGQKASPQSHRSAPWPPNPSSTGLTISSRNICDTTS